MVGAHRGGGICHAVAFERSRIVAGYRLSSSDRYTLHAENLPGDLSTVTQDAANRRSFSDFLYQLCGGLTVPKGRQASFHSNSQRGSHLDRVETQVVAHAVQARNLIQVVDLEIGSHQGQGLELQRGYNWFAFRVHKHVAALNDATRHTTFTDLTAAFEDHLAQLLGSNTLSPLELPSTEVACRKRADLLDDAQDGRGTVAMHRTLTTRFWAFDQFARKAPGGLLKSFHIVHLWSFGAGVIDHNCFESLDPHHSTQTTARG